MNTKVDAPSGNAGTAQPVHVKVSAADVSVASEPAVATATAVVSENDNKGQTQSKKEVDVFSEDPFADQDNAGSRSDPLDVEELTDDEGDSSSQEGSGEDLLATSDEEDDGEAAPEEVGVFEIFNKRCLRCQSLIPELSDEDGGRTFKKCHFTSGNEDCPAQNATIIIGVPTKKIVNAILDAEQNGESERLATIYSKLSSKDPNVQAMVHQALLAERAARAEVDPD